MSDRYTIEVARAFRALIGAADAADPDLLECDFTADMITFVATATNEKVIINTQHAVNQIWVAGAGEGIHFSLNATGQWMDDKGKQLELLSWVASCVAKASGVTLAL